MIMERDSAVRCFGLVWFEFLLLLKVFERLYWVNAFESYLLIILTVGDYR